MFTALGPTLWSLQWQRNNVRSTLFRCHCHSLARGLDPYAVVRCAQSCSNATAGPRSSRPTTSINEIENEVFGETHDVSRRIYELTREVIEFQRATKPLVPILEGLMSVPRLEDEERDYLRDVQLHALRVEERADSFASYSTTSSTSTSRSKRRPSAKQTMQPTMKRAKCDRMLSSSRVGGCRGTWPKGKRRW